MILDVTTENSVYNCVGPQARWFSHRWGKRNYPFVSLTLKQAQKASRRLVQFETLTLDCMYGDPICWDPVLEFTAKQPCHIITYGNSDIDFSQFDSSNKITFKIDGIDDQCGKVYLGANWDLIKNNILSCSNREVRFLVYKHNEHQIPQFQAFCKENNIASVIEHGYNQDGEVTCVINENHEWLYDIFRPGEDRIDSTVRRTLLGYNTLKTYIKEPTGRSILENPMVPRVFPNPSKERQLKREYNPYQAPIIAVTGHVFHNHTEYSMFSNMLCDDWVLTSTDPTDDFKLTVLFYAQTILSKELEVI